MPSDFLVLRDDRNRLYCVDREACLAQYQTLGTTSFSLEDIGPDREKHCPGCLRCGSRRFRPSSAARGFGCILLAERPGGDPLAVAGVPLSAHGGAYVVDTVEIMEPIGDSAAERHLRRDPGGGAERRRHTPQSWLVHIRTYR